MELILIILVNALSVLGVLWATVAILVAVVCGFLNVGQTRGTPYWEDPWGFAKKTGSIAKASINYFGEATVRRMETLNNVGQKEKPSAYANPLAKRQLMAIGEEQLMSDWEDALGNKKKAEFHKKVADDLRQYGHFDTAPFEPHETRRHLYSKHSPEAPIKAKTEVMPNRTSGAPKGYYVDAVGIYHKYEPDPFYGPTNYREERVKSFDEQLMELQVKDVQNQKKMQNQFLHQMAGRDSQEYLQYLNSMFSTGINKIDPTPGAISKNPDDKVWGYR